MAKKDTVNYCNKTINAVDLKYKAIGRTEKLDNGCIRFRHAASGIAITADCCGNVYFNMLTTQFEYLTVVVDGVEHHLHTDFCKDYSYLVAEDLEPGVHTIEIYRHSQQYTHTTLNYVNLNGNILEPPENKKLLIEFVGDSITSGCGNNIAETNAELTKHDTDATKAYGTLTAQALGADWSNISAGGATLCDVLEVGQQIMPKNYLLTHLYANNWDFENQRQADIVVINLGTNDSSLSYRNNGEKLNLFKTKFEDQLYDFTKRLKKLNSKKDIKVVYAFGMMADETLWVTQSYKNVATKLAEEGITVPYCQLPKDTTGGAGHPSIEGHVAAAKVLTEFIKTNLLTD